MTPTTSETKAAETLARCEAFWPHCGPSHEFVKSYLRDAIASGDQGWIDDAVKNAAPRLGDVCWICGEPMGEDGEGEPTYCSRECYGREVYP